MGLLDRTHYRFFTKYELVKLFEGAELVIDEIRGKRHPFEQLLREFREEILSLRNVHVDPEDVDTFQWLFRAVRE